MKALLLVMRFRSLSVAALFLEKNYSTVTRAGWMKMFSPT